LGLYKKKNIQVEPQVDEKAAINSTLFDEGFVDDETPLDQYNLNLLIRGIKENLKSIEASNETIKNIQDFLDNKPVFKDAQSEQNIPVNTPETSKKFATVEFVHNLLENLILIVDGGDANTAIKESWGGPPR
jgi:hypothetical protein